MIRVYREYCPYLIDVSRIVDERPAKLSKLETRYAMRNLTQTGRVRNASAMALKAAPTLETHISIGNVRSSLVLHLARGGWEESVGHAAQHFDLRPLRA